MIFSWTPRHEIFPEFLETIASLDQNSTILSYQIGQFCEPGTALRGIMQKVKLKHHTDLTPERWYKFTIFEQLGNVGSDVERAIRWRNRGEAKNFQAAFERTLELMDLTISDPKNKKRLKELVHVRKALVDYFMHDNSVYKTSDEYWQKYFMYYAYAAAVQQGK